MKHICLLFIFIFTFVPIYADDDEELISVSVRVSPDVLIISAPFTITFVIDHPSSDGVNIIPPPFPPAVSLDRLIMFPRTTDTLQQTVAEFRFVAVNSGRVVLDYFTVVTPAGIREMGPFVLNIRNPGAEQTTITPRLIWEGTTPTVTVGDRVTFTLRANGWNSPLPLPAFFMPTVPRGVILSLSPLTPEEREDGIVFKLLLIPLTPGDFFLPARQLLYENVRFNIPSLRTRIVPRPQE